jgi:predicted amidohydrolase YtcJ
MSAYNPQSPSSPGRLSASFLVAAACLLALLASGPALAEQLIDNVEGYSVGADGEIMSFTGVVIGDDGRVKELLRQGDDRPKPGELSAYYDAGGKIMLPGLVDGHVNLDELMLFALGLDLHGVRDTIELSERLTRYATENDARTWLLGRGWGPTTFDGADRRMLDAVVPDRPVLLLDAIAGQAIANSRALELLGLDGDGRLSGEQLALARERLPEIRPVERDLGFSAAQTLLLSSGITALSDMGTDIADWQVYRRAGDEGRLQLRISAYADGIDAMELIAGSRPTPWLYEDRLRLTGVYLPVDPAAVNAGDDAPSSRAANADLKNRMARAALDDFPITLGAGYDAGAWDEAAAAIREVAESYEGSEYWRITGMTPPPVTDGSALAQYNVTVAIGHSNASGPAMAHASFAPAAHPARFSELTRSELPQRTVIPADHGKMARFAGSLSPGKWADFILLEPPRPDSPSFVGEVVETWIAGRPVWRRGYAPSQTFERPLNAR